MSNYSELLKDLEAAENYLDYLEEKVLEMIHADSYDAYTTDEIDYTSWQIKTQKKLIKEIEINIAYAEKEAA